MTFPYCEPDFPESLEKIPSEEDECTHPDASSCHPIPYVKPWEEISPAEYQSASSDILLFTEPGLHWTNLRLIIEAMAAVRDSWDIVSHCCCMHFGPGHEVCECLRAFLFSSIEIGIAAELKADDGSRRPAGYSKSDGVIWFDNGFLDCYVGAGVSFADVEGEARAALLAYYASILVHEALHACLDDLGVHGSHHDDLSYPGLEGVPNENDCDLIEEVDECVRIALEDRYGAGIFDLLGTRLCP